MTAKVKMAMIGVTDMLVKGREAWPRRMAVPAGAQASPGDHRSVRWLIEPVTHILEGPLDLEAHDGRTCGGMSIPKESTP